MSKYYGVKQGVTPGVYTSWPECQQQVNGYKGAEYKSFKTEAEAHLYVYGDRHEPVQDYANMTIRLNAEETSELKYLLNAIRDADSLEDIVDYIDNIEDLIGPIL